MANISQEKELTAKGGEVAALVVEGSRIGKYPFLATDIGAKFPHGLIAEPKT